jgi:hypothetical protein
MAVSTHDLLEATKAVKSRSDSSVGWPLAAIKAIQSKSITHGPDVRRLTRVVMNELRNDRSNRTHSTKRSS